ncbi:SGNH/GDSL hydrolase family protein [Desertivirga arenae]|uniref:SGNH/GDSL hydrolase family protein n=1 Tax=Desertivirga arenae TaxID=2810309 RepID=UPI001A95F242|nr:SGNH/GDSL hydrolase family protein [Pedobacter sp. SYSU D00823]
MTDFSRRRFLQSLTLASATVFIEPENLVASEHQYIEDPEKKLTFLFQGDSITDGNRGRNTDPNHIMGHGYAFSAASRIAADFAEKDLVFYNRGISGNKVTDLQKRWEEDSIALKPDVLSILVGINDVAAVIQKPESAKSPEEFKAIYHDILQRSMTANPKLLLLLGLPFVYPVGRVKENWELWSREVEKRGEVVRKLAREFDAVLIDYPSVFTKAFKRKEPAYWIWDGVHPTIAGHELMAREWLKQVSSRIRFLKKYKY